MKHYKCYSCNYFQTLNKTKTCRKCGVNKLIETSEIEILSHIANILGERK